MLDLGRHSTKNFIVCLRLLAAHNSPACDLYASRMTALPRSVEASKGKHEGPMASVMILCPDTRREVYTGIETDDASFAKLPDVIARMHCPLCGEEHAWTKHKAWLAEPVLARKRVA